MEPQRRRYTIRVGWSIAATLAAGLLAVALAHPAQGGLNQDGTPDLIFANYWNSYPNSYPPNQQCIADGNGGYTCTDVESGRYQTAGIAIGDVDGDGLWDVVFANQNFANRICLGTPGGLGACSPLTTPQFMGGFGVSHEAVVTDLDRDRAADIVFAMGAGWPAYILYGDDPEPVEIPGTSMWDNKDVAVGDLTGDGWPDLLFASTGDGGKANLLCAFRGERSFACVPASSHEENTEGVAIADINDDGSLDAVFANSWQVNRVCWGPAHPTTGFASCDPVGWATDDTTDVAVLDEPGVPPRIVFAQSGQGGGADRWNTICAYDGGFTCEPLSVDWGAAKVAVGDLDNDGDQDIAFAAWSSRVCLQDSGGFTCTIVTADRNTAVAIVPSASPPVADLRLSKSVDIEEPRVGQWITYTVTVANDGPYYAEGVVVSDPLPGSLTLHSAPASNGSYDPDTGLWTLADTLAPGTEATLAIVASAYDVGAITNTAEVVASSLADPDSTPANGDAAEDDLASTTLTVSPALADVSVAAWFESPTLFQGDTAVVFVQVANDGPDTATGMAVTVVLPDGLSYSTDGSGGAFDPPTGVWTVPFELGPGEETRILIEAVVEDVGEHALVAELTAADLADPDSTPANGDPNEDDQASVALTAQPRPPRIEASLTFGWVGVLTRSADKGFDVAVFDATGTVVHRSTQAIDEEGWAGVRTGLCFDAGYRVVAVGTTTGATSELVLEQLALNTFDPNTGIVTGAAPSGRTVVVAAEDDAFGRATVTTAVDELGSFQADFSGVADVRPDTYVQARLDDPDGDTTLAELVLPAAFEASLTFDWIGSPGAFRGDCSVEIEVQDRLGAVVLGPAPVEVDADGAFFFEPGIDLESGQTITVSGDRTGRTKSLTLADLLLTHYLSDVDVVRGTGPHEAWAIEVWAGNETDQHVIVLERDGGPWHADFAGVGFDLTLDMHATARIHDTDGDTTISEKVGHGDMWSSPSSGGVVEGGTATSIISVHRPPGGYVAITAVPADSEVEDGFLILGHRFHVYADPVAEPDRIRIAITSWYPRGSWVAWEGTARAFVDGSFIPECVDGILQPDPCARVLIPTWGWGWVSVEVFTSHASEWYLGLPVVGVGPITAAASVPIGAELDASAPFANLLDIDTASIEWDWGDGTTSPGLEEPAQVSGSHVYAQPGVYTVAVTVTDANGNAGSRSLQVTVLSPADATQALIERVLEVEAAGEMKHGDATSLVAKLTQAVKELERGRKAAAVSKIDSFIGQVTDLVVQGKLEAGIGADLISAATRLRASYLGAGSGSG